MTLTTQTLESTLAHAVTEYDRRQSTRRGHNANALALYLAAVEEAVALVAKGTDVQSALRQCFTDRLLSACQRAVAWVDSR